MDDLTLDSEKDTKLDTAVTRIIIAFDIPTNMSVCVTNSLLKRKHAANSRMI